MKISIQENGPYLITGHVPLVEKTQVTTEFGEPVAWEKGGDIVVGATFELCRCGQSADKPFCDGTHSKTDWDGTESAETTTTAERREAHPGGKQIVVRRDYSVCCESGFCGTRLANIQRMLAQAQPDDTNLRSQVIAMVERCPSGSYTYSVEGNDKDDKAKKDIEPDLPKQIAVTTEVTSDGPIAGALWVTGGVQIERADGQPMEARNRVTLCRCGASKNKPLCDGTHRAARQTAATP
jgi:CDGSH-type Zn-finger protein